MLSHPYVCCLSARIAGLVLAVASVVGGASSASANIVIDFESIGHGRMMSGSSNFHSEHGFQLRSSAFASWSSNNINYAGSTALFAFFDSDTTELSATNGRTFSFDSIDLSEAFTHQSDTYVTFTGFRRDGSQVSDSVSLDNVFGFETHRFSGFNNLLSVRWNQESSYHQFDNLNLRTSVIPAPGALALGAFGLGMVGWMKRRQTAA